MESILETPRLRLRETTEADAPFFYALNAEPEAIRYTGDAPFASEEAARQFLRDYGQYRKYGYGRWAVQLKSSGEWLGWCGLKYLPETDETDVGFRFFKRYWGQGYASEAARACMSYGFGPLGLKLIVGRAMLANGASRRVLEKIGMMYERTIIMEGQPGSYYTMRADSPSRVMLALNAAQAWDWQELPAPGQAFRLRRLRPKDAPSLARHADDPGVAFRLRDRFPHPYAEEDAQKFIAYALSSRKETIYAIEAEGQAAGTISLMFREGLDYPVAETGYWLGRAYWGRGIVSAAVQIMVRHGFQDLGLMRIFAGVYSNNPASRRVLEKCGFLYEGTAPRAIVRNGAVLDAWYLGISNEEC